MQARLGNTRLASDAESDQTDHDQVDRHNVVEEPRNQQNQQNQQNQDPAISETMG